MEKSPQLAHAEDDWSDDAPWTERWGRAQSSVLPKEPVALGSSLDSAYHMGLLASDSSGHPDSTFHDARARREREVPYFSPFMEEPLAPVAFEPVTVNGGGDFGSCGSRWRRQGAANEALFGTGGRSVRPPPPLPTSPIARAPPLAPQLVPRHPVDRGNAVDRGECHVCGAAYLDDELFCRRCGARRTSTSGRENRDSRTYREEGLRQEAFNALAAAPQPPPKLRDTRPQRHSGSGATATDAELRRHGAGLAPGGPSLAVPKLERRTLPEPPSFLEPVARGLSEPVARVEGAMASARALPLAGAAKNSSGPTRWTANREESAPKSPRLTGTSSRPDLLIRAMPERCKSSYALNAGDKNAPSRKVERGRPLSARTPRETRSADRSLSEPKAPAAPEMERRTQRSTIPTQASQAQEDARNLRQTVRRSSSCSSVPCRRRTREAAGGPSTLEAEAEALRKENAILKRRLLAMHEATVTGRSRPSSPLEPREAGSERAKSPFGRSRAALLQGQQTWPTNQPSRQAFRNRLKPGWSSRTRAERA